MEKKIADEDNNGSCGQDSDESYATWWIKKLFCMES